MIKDKLIPSLLLFPFLSHWVFPDGLEKIFYVDFFGFPIYLFDICYIIYILSYGGPYCTKALYSNKYVKVSVKLYVFLFVFYEILLNNWTNNSDVLIKLICNNMFVMSAWVYILYPMNYDSLDKTKYIVIGSAIIISFEVILFASGIIHYDLDLGNQEYGGIIRISSTVGAATGTAVALVICGALIASVYNLNENIRWVIILILTIAIFLTVSRGSICLWLIFLFYVIYRRYLYKSHLGKKIACIGVLIVIIFSLNEMGVLNPVLERQNQLSAQGNSATGRDDLQNQAINVCQMSNFIGVGHGETNLEKSIKNTVVRSHPVGVHSLYYMTLAELGIPGFVMLVGFLIFIMLHFDNKKLISIYSFLLVFFTFSTEPMFIFAEFAAPSFFIISISLKKKNENFVYL